MRAVASAVHVHAEQCPRKRVVVYTVCACAPCFRELTVKDFVNSLLLNGLNMRARNADFTCRDGEFHAYRLPLLRLYETLHGPLQSRRLEQVSSCSHGKAIKSTYKLYRLSLLLYQDDVTEDRAYDGGSNELASRANKQTRPMITYSFTECFTK